MSYVWLVMLAGALLLSVVWVFLLRYVPPSSASGRDGFSPGRGDLIRAFIPAATGAFVFLLLLSLAGGWVLAGRMLAPLNRMTAATREAATGHLSHRIRMKGRQDEFRELADAFDSMLTQIEAHVSEQQRFAANASHELRTPLAIMQTLIDVAQHDRNRDHAADLARLKETNTRAIEVTEALLLLSRADKDIPTREAVDLSLFAEQAAETLLPLAEAHHVRIDIDGDITMATGSPPLLLQLIANLIHNAIVHNHPGGGSVQVTTQETPAGGVLTVENTGTELTPERVAMLTEPFLRGTDRARTEGYTGTGLGLSIVERIIQAHHGTLGLTPREGGGLHVRVEFPREPTATNAGTVGPVPSTE
ncbi:HAMP domain-containing sensor histidine kinase [Leifsonia sp. ALI-44-B]|uniref:sensor histidine kinase n=1 Tax=Leifsonia sp. ALI-44-B TaxID=1933776 RepID=UPI00336A0CED